MMPAMHGHAETFACVDREQRTRQELPEHGVDCVRQVRRDRRLLVEAQAVAYADDHDDELQGGSPQQDGAPHQGERQLNHVQDEGQGCATRSGRAR